MGFWLLSKELLHRFIFLNVQQAVRAIYIYILILKKIISNKQCVSFQFLKGCWNLFFKTKVIWKVKCNNYFNISQIECHTA